MAAAGSLLLPLASTGFADSALAARHPEPAADAAQPASPPRTDQHGTGRSANDARGGQRAARPPGSTQSLPLDKPSGSARAGDRLLSAWQDDPAGGRRVTTRHVRPFAMLGVVWKNSDDRPSGRIQVQTRDSHSGRWSGWRALDTHDDDRPGSSDGPSGGDAVRGSTAPVWVGDSNAVRVRVTPAAGSDGAGSKQSPAADARKSGSQDRTPQLPGGTRLELVDPGPNEPEPDRPETDPAAKGRQDPGASEDSESTDGAARKGGPENRPGGVLPALGTAETKARYGKKSEAESAAAGGSHIGPRPGIVTRKGWGADEKLRERQFLYTKTVRAAFVHHTAESNNYSCAKTPAIIRGIYRYHVVSSKWRDIGYNFLIDKCGKIYEGRAGGVARAVMGAHTYGFNNDTTGIAVIGNFNKTQPSRTITDALAKLTAWKLGIHGVNAAGKVSLVSGGGTKYRKGTRVTFNAISGHRDGYVTACPGAALYAKLPALRAQAARLQGR